MFVLILRHDGLDDSVCNPNESPSTILVVQNALI